MIIKIELEIDTVEDKDEIDELIQIVKLLKSKINFNSIMEKETDD
jgi:hypothetical protein